jgi:hypothetical protein
MVDVSVVFMFGMYTVSLGYDGDWYEYDVMTVAEVNEVLRANDVPLSYED